MRVFITGGTGFIGSHVVKKIQEEKNEILLLSPLPKFSNISENTKIVEGNLSNPEDWRKELKDFKPETTIHLAWEGIPNYDSETSIKNLKYGLELFSLLAEIGCKSILSTGSCWEYGGQPGKLSENTTPKPLNAFTSAKNALHLLGKEIANENNMNFIWTRLFYVYGPGQKKESLIPYLINCIKKGKTPEIKNPSAQNDFIYVGDVAEAISLLIQNCKRSGIYNIGSGRLTSIQDIIKIIYNNFGLQKDYKNTTPGTTDIFSGFWADISKIKNDVGWEPKTEIQKGIKKIINA